MMYVGIYVGMYVLRITARKSSVADHRFEYGIYEVHTYILMLVHAYAPINGSFPKISNCTEYSVDALHLC